MHGFLSLDKLPGVSSNHAINRVKRLLPGGTKIGHAGTLDPLATGILVLLLGRCTKQCESVMHLQKQYLATVTLGATTATDDAEAPPLPLRVERRPTRQDIDRVVSRFVGTINQTPPVYSALKHAGRRACDLVRQGQHVVMQPRVVRIDFIDVVTFDYPLLTLRVACGRGTYIRSLARDIGQALSTGGYLSALRRTRVGPFDESNCKTIEQLASSTIQASLLPPTFLAV